VVPSIVRKATLVLIAAAIAGCTGNPPALTSGAPVADLQPAARITEKIDNYAYQPKTITVKAGTTIKFVNKDSVTHTVTAMNGSFRSPLILPGKSWKHTFKTAGKFKFYCQIHPFMKGVLDVTK